MSIIVLGDIEVVGLSMGSSLEKVEIDKKERKGDFKFYKQIIRDSIIDDWKIIPYVLEL